MRNNIQYNNFLSENNNLFLLFHRIGFFKDPAWEDVSENFFLHSIKKTLKVKNCNNYRHNIIYTFDDGYLSDYNIAYPALLENNLKGLFFIITNKTNSKNYLNRNMILEMSDSGMIIGSHSHTHINLLNVDYSIAFNELDYSKKILEDMIGIEVNNFSFPFGYESNRIAMIAKSVGYKFIYGSKFGISNQSDMIFRRNNINSSYSIDDFESTIKYSNITSIKNYLKFISKSTLKNIFTDQFYKKLRGLLS